MNLMAGTANEEKARQRGYSSPFSVTVTQTVIIESYLLGALRARCLAAHN